MKPYLILIMALLAIFATYKLQVKHMDDMRDKENNVNGSHGPVVTNFIELSEIPFKFSDRAELEIRRLCQDEMKRAFVRQVAPDVQFFGDSRDGMSGFFSTNYIDATTVSNLMNHAYPIPDKYYGATNACIDASYMGMNISGKDRENYDKGHFVMTNEDSNGHLWIMDNKRIK